ncbi:Amphiphysin [Strongyloides ratti]|uniref:Amphiphysin n=1 Tax=Strongyloides ratti TaxID=34506 RepID=A0A090LE18_STRRB|nr:Amphiphysin [Strongyloides ratti]CEF65715.1 Amphiphysin [Strongyloides ratti]
MSDLFGKHLKKKTARAKEKLLGGLGKGKATTDEEFDRNVCNVNKQAKVSEKLYRDMKNYATSLKALHVAEEQLRSSIKDMYEEEWPNSNHFIAALQGVCCAEEEYERKFNEEILKSVYDYKTQFSDIQKKIEKRGRKLVDFDAATREYENIKHGGKKSDDDPKVLKAKEEMMAAEEKYNKINNELNGLLPVLFDSRITFFVDTFQTLFDTQATKDGEASKQKKTIVVELDKLGMDLQNLRVTRTDSPTDNSTPNKHNTSNNKTLDDFNSSKISQNLVEEDNDVKKIPPPKPKRQRDPLNPFDDSDNDEEF